MADLWKHRLVVTEQRILTYAFHAYLEALRIPPSIELLQKMNAFLNDVTPPIDEL